MQSRFLGTALATIVEAPAVYGFLRLWQDGHRLWAIPLLMVGETLETTFSGFLINRHLADRPLANLAVGRRHLRKLQKRMLALSFAEVGVWVVWLLVVGWLGQWAGFGVLAVLMHVKHQGETATIRATPYSTGLVSARVTSASLIETAGAAGSLALIRDGRPWLAAAALVGGLAIEHTILVGLLQREMDVRDIRMPRVPGPRRPAAGLLASLVEWFAGNFGLAWKLVGHVQPLRLFLNRLAINALIGAVPYRPEPLSTMAPYTSWASLTDRTWSGRHWPPVNGIRDAPALEEVAALFRRDGQTVPCPKSTVLFPCFAQWFTDGFLRTDRGDPGAGRVRDTRRNESTHQVDLTQLYGLNSAMTDQLRSHVCGRLKSQHINGEEYPQHLCSLGVPKREFDRLLPVFGFDKLTLAQKNEVFAMGSDTRNLGFTAFNVLFLREHNRIAEELASTYPEWDDDRLFATARMILIVVLMKIVVEEYINHINSFYFKFSLQPLSFRNEPWQRPNWMAIEFNLLYRWHSLVPSAFHVGGRTLTVEESLTTVGALTSTGLGGFMAAASHQPAGRIGLFNTDAFLVALAEVPTVQQGRNAGVAPYNDYRELCHLPKVKAFEDLSTSPAVRAGLRDLYKKVDDVEFYVGLLAEAAGPNDVLPPLMTAMVSFDAFSQVLTNPLVAPAIYGEHTFSPAGMRIIADTRSISDLVHRNVPKGEEHFISLTRRDYERV
jgi:prostaglandin-endoperoxide synthase 2